MNKIIGNPFDIAYRIIIKEDIINILVDSMKCFIDINNLLIQINKVTGENKESITEYNIKLFCYGNNNDSYFMDVFCCFGDICDTDVKSLDA